MQVLPLLATFVEEDDTLVVHALQEMVLKRIQIQKLKRFRLKNQRSLTLKDPKRYGYLNQLEFYVVGFKEG